MSVARITEITAASSKSFDDAMRVGIERASKTVENITRAWVQEQYVTVKNGSIEEYRVNMKVTFILKE